MEEWTIIIVREVFNVLAFLVMMITSPPECFILMRCEQWQINCLSRPKLISRLRSSYFILINVEKTGGRLIPTFTEQISPSYKT